MSCMSIENKMLNCNLLVGLFCLEWEGWAAVVRAARLAKGMERGSSSTRCLNWFVKVLFWHQEGI